MGEGGGGVSVYPPGLLEYNVNYGRVFCCRFLWCRRLTWLLLFDLGFWGFLKRGGKEEGNF